MPNNLAKKIVNKAKRVEYLTRQPEFLTAYSKLSELDKHLVRIWIQNIDEDQLIELSKNWKPFGYEDLPVLTLRQLAAWMGVKQYANKSKHELLAEIKNG